MIEHSRFFGGDRDATVYLENDQWKVSLVERKLLVRIEDALDEAAAEELAEDWVMSAE